MTKLTCLINLANQLRCIVGEIKNKGIVNVYYYVDENGTLTLKPEPIYGPIDCNYKLKPLAYIDIQAKEYTDILKEDKSIRYPVNDESYLLRLIECPNLEDKFEVHLRKEGRIHKDYVDQGSYNVIQTLPELLTFWEHTETYNERNTVYVIPKDFVRLRYIPQANFESISFFYSSLLDKLSKEINNNKMELSIIEDFEILNKKPKDIKVIKSRQMKYIAKYGGSFSFAINSIKWTDEVFDNFIVSMNHPSFIQVLFQYEWEQELIEKIYKANMLKNPRRSKWGKREHCEDAYDRWFYETNSFLNLLVEFFPEVEVKHLIKEFNQ